MFENRNNQPKRQAFYLSDNDHNIKWRRYIELKRKYDLPLIEFYFNGKLIEVDDSGHAIGKGLPLLQGEIANLTDEYGNVIATMDMSRRVKFCDENKLQLKHQSSLFNSRNSLIGGAITMLALITYACLYFFKDKKEKKNINQDLEN